MIKKLTSKKGVSPILASLLLIAIAVAASVITYAWVTTFVTRQTQQSGAVLGLKNIRFYQDSTTGDNKTEIEIANTGTASAEIVSVYWSDSSFTGLVRLEDAEYIMDPTDGIVDADSSITITVTWGAGANLPVAWTPDATYYFKVVTDTNQQLPFAEEAP